MVRKILTKNKIKLVIFLVAVFLIGLYNLAEHVNGMCKWIYNHVTAPAHSLTAGICDLVDFSVGEVLIVIAVILIFTYTVASIYKAVRNKELIQPVISWVITCITVVTVIYSGFCYLWGVYYSSADSSSIYGMDPDGVDHEDLIKVDTLFVNMANEYSVRVNRDASGHYIMDREEVFTDAGDLYCKLEQEYPSLYGKVHKPKPFFFSKAMSYMDFTGFFFPFTAEANINMDSPQVMTPSTIAHELAHQRGVAAEDEANFTAVLACMTGGSDDYIYSASLLAMVHLQNALYKSGDLETWQKLRDSYSDEVRTDLADNSAYWKKYRDNPVTKVSEGTYDAFLKSYNQTLGRETYGACVDLLVEYYK